MFRLNALAILDLPTGNRGTVHDGSTCTSVYPTQLRLCGLFRQTAVPDGAGCPLHSLLRNPGMVQSGLEMLPTFSVLFFLLTLRHALFYNFFFLISLFTTRESSSSGSLRGIVPRSEDAEASV